jgi:hypothetical protein
MSTAPHESRLSATVPASTILATYDQSLGEAPYDGEVSAASYTPEANITGAASPASRTLSIINKGADGNGTTVVASLELLSGVNLTDFNETALTLSAVEGATEVAAGDVLAFTSAPVGGTGLVDPGGLVQVTISRG